MAETVQWLKDQIEEWYENLDEHEKYDDYDANYHFAEDIRYKNVTLPNGSVAIPQGVYQPDEYESFLLFSVNEDTYAFTGYDNSWESLWEDGPFLVEKTQVLVDKWTIS